MANFKSKTDKKIEYSFFILALCAGLFLLFNNLGNQYLWQDEAQTALIAKTILAHGVPLGYDGKNFFSQELGAEYGRNYLWKWHTWLPFYLTAASFKLLGVSTLSARLPFALFGMATIVLTYFFTLSLWRDDRAAVIALILILFSVPFLILSRQSRYYSLTAFFSLSGLYSYLNLVEGKRYASFMFFVSAALLFHVHYIYCAALLLSVFIHTLFCHNKNYIRKILAICASVILINLPWIFWISGMKYASCYGAAIFKDGRFASFLQSFLADIDKHIFPTQLLIIPLIAGAINWLSGRPIFLKGLFVRKNLALISIFFAVNIIALSLLSPFPFFRYMTPLIPILYIVIALVIVRVMDISRVLGSALFLLVIFSNPLYDYFYEITHEFDGPMEGVSKYLNNHGRDADTVAITYGDLPLKFYTNMRVVGGLTGEDLLPAKKADWIILRKHVICEKDFKVREYLLDNINWDDYEKITIDYPDATFENREDPSAHLYKTKNPEDKVCLYKLKTKPGL